TVREPLLVLDQELKVIKASRSFYEFFKVSSDETIGKLIYNLGNDQWDIPKLRELLETILPEKTTFDNYEVEHDFATIGKRIMLLNAQQIKRAFGKEKMILLAIEDITERKLAEAELSKYQDHLKELVEELRTSNQELEAFAYSVSHDLRAPLRAINGFTRILLQDYVERLDDEAKRLGSVIQKNSQKMGQLIDDLLAFSRLGRATMHFSNIDMKKMVNEVYEEATTPSERKRINFSITELFIANGDPNMFRQVWINLISNALKFSANQKQAVISVTCREEEDKLNYCIKDNGAGFNMKYIDKLFRVFQRLHSEKEYPGTGVGLALVKRIIQRHGGKIWAEGEIGKGAAFYFSLPKK
ncbi:MAG: ATP-binding protein, partial [Candidatus Cloacimonetes bacterium]|nr:ATP-binding protein [Candidatus Cloacimonadota bacterium]